MSFNGEIIQKADAKGRVSIPADFRRALEAADPEWSAGSDRRARLRLVYGVPDQPFLEGYSIAEFALLEERIDSVEDDDRRELLLDFYIQGAEQCTIDEDGRIILNQRLRDRLGLPRDGGEVVFAGRSHTFRIWLPEDLAADKRAKKEIAGRILPPTGSASSLLPPRPKGGRA